MQLNEQGRGGLRGGFTKGVDESLNTTTTTTNSAASMSNGATHVSPYHSFDQSSMRHRHSVAGMEHGEFLLSSIIHPIQLMKVIGSYIQKRGCAQPVGELGKMLQSLTGCVSISNRIKSECGGLKKAIEIHG